MFFDDEDDIFSGGSPKKKFFDIVYHANRNLVENEIDGLIKRLCAVESLLEEKMDADAIERKVKEMTYVPSKELEDCTASLYMELTANILSQNE